MRVTSVCFVSALILGVAAAFIPFELLVPDGRISLELVEKFGNGSVLDTGDAETKRNKRSVAPSPLDTLVDFILTYIVPQIVSHGEPALPMKDFSFEMKANMETVYKFSGWISATGGSLKNFKSLFRYGPAVLRQESNRILLLQVAAGIQLLELSYRYYNASLGGLKFHGQMEGGVSQPIMNVEIELVPPCTIRLRSLKVSQMGKLQLKITGLPQAISTLPSVAERLFDHPDVQNEIQKIVIDEGKTILEGFLKKLPCK